MKIRDIMNTHPITLEVGTDFTLARHTMAWADVRHLPVIDAERHVKGILSEHDVLAYVSRERDIGQDKSQPFPVVDAVMNTDIKTASPEDSVTEAAARLAQGNIGCLPVTEKGKLVGLVTRTDVLRGEVRQSMQEKPSAVTAGELMTANPQTVIMDDYLLNAAGRMQSVGVRHLPVVNGADEIVGILSDRDIRAAIGDPMRAHDDDTRVALNLLRVSDAMTRGLFFVEQTESLSAVSSLFVNQRLSAAPVVDSDGKLVGIISYLDLLRANQ